MRRILGVLLNGIASFTLGTKRRTALVLLSAVLLPLAMPNELLLYGNPVIACICLIPFFIAASEPDKYKTSLVLGIAFGVLSTLIMCFWLKNYGEYSVWTIGGVLLAYALFGAVLFPSMSALLAVAPGHKPVVFACGWTFYELLKSSGFLAFPWGLLAHPFHDVLPFIQISDIAGVWGVSFLVALINGTLGDWFGYRHGRLPGLRASGASDRALSIRKSLFAAILVCASLAYGGFRLMQPVPVETTLSAVLVQPNSDPWARNAYEKSISNCIELTRRGIEELGEKPDLVVWNETSFQHPFPGSEASLERFPKDNPFMPFLRSTGTYFLVGAPFAVDRGSFGYMNAAVLLTEKGEISGYYGKIQPVPFVESNPFWELKFLRPLFGLIGISGTGWTMGKEHKVLDVPLRDGTTIGISTPICFEDAFPDLCRRFLLNGATVLVNLTNVSWSKTSSAELQMFVASKFRAVETKRTFIRSTNSGVTSVIGPFGETLASVPLFSEEHIAMKIPIYKERGLTAYTVCGDFFPLIAGAVVFFVLGYGFIAPFRGTRKRDKAQPPLFLL